MPRLTSLSRSVSGLVALVTGAASGMGRATALVLADEGAKVAVTDVVDPAPVVDAIAKAGGEATGRILDVSDGAAIARVVSDVAAHFGGIDILINNAGIARPTPLDAPGWEEAWAETIAVNLTADPDRHDGGNTRFRQGHFCASSRARAALRGSRGGRAYDRVALPACGLVLQRGCSGGRRRNDGAEHMNAGASGSLIASPGRARVTVGVRELAAQLSLEHLADCVTGQWLVAQWPSAVRAASSAGPRRPAWARRARSARRSGTGLQRR